MTDFGNPVDPAFTARVAAVLLLLLVVAVLMRLVARRTRQPRNRR